MIVQFYEIINKGNDGWIFFLNDKTCFYLFFIFFIFYFYEREEGKLGDISAFAKARISTEK